MYFIFKKHIKTHDLVHYYTHLFLLYLLFTIGQSDFCTFYSTFPTLTLPRAFYQLFIQIIKMSNALLLINTICRISNNLLAYKLCITIYIYPPYISHFSFTLGKLFRLFNLFRLLHLHQLINEYSTRQSPQIS